MASGSAISSPDSHAGIHADGGVGTEAAVKSGPPPFRDGGTATGGSDNPSLDPSDASASDPAESSAQKTASQEAASPESMEDLNELVDVNRLAREQAEAATRAAEAARQETLAAAERSQNEIQTRLLNRLANAKSIQVEISSSRAVLFRETERDLETVRRTIERVRRRGNDYRSLAPLSVEADQAFLRASTEEAEALSWVKSALRRKDAFEPARASMDNFEQGLREERRNISTLLSAEDLESVRQIVNNLEQERIQLEKNADLLKGEASYRFFLLANQRMEVAKLHHQQRMDLLPNLTENLSGDLRGFHERALEQAKLIARFHWTAFSLHVHRRYFDLLHLPERKQGFFGWGAVLGHWLMALFTTWLGAWGWRKVPSLYQRTRQLFVGKSKTMGRARMWEGTFRLASLLAPRVFLLLYVEIVFNELKESSPRPELDLVAEFIQWIIAYQLVTDLVCRFILRIAERRHLLAAELRNRVLTTMRRMFRYGFFAGLTHQMAIRFLGNGLATAVVHNLLMLGALFLLLAVLRQWRTDIAQAYLRGWPQTRLASSVQSADAHWYGFFVSIAAFSFVAGKALYSVGTDFVLGFDHTRRALAYLFRLQIERSARERPPRQFDASVLPATVLEIFSEEDAATSRNFTAGLLVPEFPELERISKELSATRGSAGIYWLHGSYGMGRSTWLMRLQAAVSSARPCYLLTPSRRLHTPQQLWTWLGEELSLGRLGNVHDFTESFSTREPAVVMIDGLEWFFLRTIGGYDALHALLDVARATRGQVDWVWSVPQPTHRHLMYAKRLFERVGTQVQLKPWSEASIRELIRIRQRATGHVVSFEDLLIRDVEQIELSAQVVKNEEQYIRLLWNFAQGNPMTAQHFWLRSLVAGDDGALHVNLYDVPSVEELERFPDLDRFIMMTFVLHRCLSIEEAALSCAIDLGIVESHVQRGLSVGLYRRLPGATELFAVDTHYWEAVRRFLQRKNLL